MSNEDRDPAASCTLRTRLAVLGVLVATTLLAGSAYGLLTISTWKLPVPDVVVPRLFTTLLLVTFATSFVLMRGLGGRSALADPATRCGRFFASRVVAAAVGAQGASLGVLYAASLRPPSSELAPFWVAALASVALAFPRGYELGDFDEPMR